MIFFYFLQKEKYLECRYQIKSFWPKSWLSRPRKSRLLQIQFSEVLIEFMNRFNLVIYYGISNLTIFLTPIAILVNIYPMT